MVKIRLTKTGRRNAPSYRIVVADARSPRDGKFIEVIGFYNPSHNPTLSKIDKEKYEAWIKKGAQPTEAVKQIVDGTYKFVPYNPKAIAAAKEKAKEGAEAKDSAEAKVGEREKKEPASEKKKEEPASKEKPDDNKSK